MTVAERLIGTLERLGYNLLQSHKDVIEAFVRATDTTIVEQLIAAVDKNFHAPLLTGPVDRFFSNSAGDFEADLDADVLGAFQALESALDNAAKSSGA
jgi:hypothetical protein